MGRAEVVMPQMGESIADGTVVQWLKGVGDVVERDENILEISTDKVDAEIPSPVSGRLAEIIAQPGETVAVGSVIAWVETDAAVQPAPAAAPAAAPPQAPAPVAVAPAAAPTAGSSRIDVAMPQMGESIVEGTVVQWLKAVGDVVERDENILEISTDKVDAEIPSPANGTIVEILVQPGETVAVGTVVARLSGAAGAGAPAPTAVPTVPAPSVAATPAAPATRAVAGPPNGGATGYAAMPAGLHASADDLRRTRSTPLVRKIAREHNVDIRQLSGSGLSGRVTKRDILAFLEHRTAAPQARAASMPSTTAPLAAKPVHVAVHDGDRIEVMSPMRAKIAEHMVTSRRTSPHAHTIHEVDFSAVVRARKTLKPEFEARGERLTFTTFIVKACIDALTRYPIVNSSVSGNQVIYRSHINVGVAVALEDGLIVPVVKDADELNLFGLSRRINDLAGRARIKKLKPQEVGGGTFTVTNPGIFGSLFGIPIINQPQVAILGCGAVKKRIVIDDDDNMSIRPIGVFCLSFDHRVVDGAIADHFMVHIKNTLQNWEA